MITFPQWYAELMADCGTEEVRGDINRIGEYYLYAIWQQDIQPNLQAIIDYCESESPNPFV
jgi:hypothetical protein